MNMTEKTTEAQLVQDQLRYQNLLLRAQQETSPDGVLVVDQDGLMKSWNQRFLDIWGLSEQVMLAGEASQALEVVKPLLADPEAFTCRVDHLYRHLEECESGWEVALADGRVLERHSRGLVDETGRYWGRVWFYRDITHRVQLERELRQHQEHLEELVAYRTAELEAEVERHRTTEEKLLGKEQDLEAQTRRLEETNTALRVLLNQSSEDKKALSRGFRTNLEFMVLPYLEELEASGLTSQQLALAEVVRTNLEQLVSPFMAKLLEVHPDLTHREVQVADLVRGGKANKEIASLLGISVRAVEFHRENLRRKTGITGRRANLRSRLLSLT
jgi:PAS domain S-box-containing protein